LLDVDFRVDILDLPPSTIVDMLGTLKRTIWNLGLLVDTIITHNTRLKIFHNWLRHGKKIGGEWAWTLWIETIVASKIQKEDLIQLKLEPIRKQKYIYKAIETLEDALRYDEPSI